MTTACAVLERVAEEVYETGNPKTAIEFTEGLTKVLRRMAELSEEKLEQEPRHDIH